MITIECKAEGLEELMRKATPDILVGPVTAFFRKALLYMETQAARNAPVDTGRLRASITSVLDSRPVPLWGKVTSNVFCPLCGVRHQTTHHCAYP